MATNLITGNPASTSPALTNDLRAIKAPVEIPSGWTWLWWVLGALVLIALLYWAWRRFHQKPSQPPAPPVPPHVRARQALQEALAFLHQPREFCIRVSDTLRWYLEERFSLHAPERTTEEFLHELQSSSLLSQEQKSSLQDFLQRCDLVKFAKYEPREPELRDLHTAATRLVDETEPQVPLSERAPGSSVESSPAPTTSA